MIAAKCDRCGKYFEPLLTSMGTSAVSNIYLRTRCLNSGSIIKDFKKVDVCPTCEQSFIEWLHSVKPEEADKEDEKSCESISVSDGSDTKDE